MIGAQCLIQFCLAGDGKIRNAECWISLSGPGVRICLRDNDPSIQADFEQRFDRASPGWTVCGRERTVREECDDNQQSYSHPQSPSYVAKQTSGQVEGLSIIFELILEIATALASP